MMTVKEIIFETSTEPFDPIILGRNEAISKLEEENGLLQREFVYVEGAENVQGIVILPYTDYDVLYWVKGEYDNPSELVYIEEYKEGIERPYYKKVGSEVWVYVPHFSGIGGAQASPRYIETIEELQSLTASTYAMLAKDIDASDTVNWNSGAGFIPIGTSAAPFKAFFDGNGFTIKNLFINRPTLDYAGLFGYAAADTSNNTKKNFIRNLKLDNANIKGKNYVGGIVGYCNTAIYNLEVMNSKIEGIETYTGGIAGIYSGVGYSYFTTGHGDGKRLHSLKSINNIIIGNNRTGGAIGSVTGTSGGDLDSIIVDSCNITGNDSTGGAVGYHTVPSTNTSIKVKKTIVNGKKSTGGVFGVLHGGTALISLGKASFDGDINATDGSDSIGGIVGSANIASGSDSTIEDCYSSGNINASNCSNIGGIIGYGASNIGVYSAGWNNSILIARRLHTQMKISGLGNTNVDALIGKVQDMAYATVIDNYFDKEISGISSSPYGTGLLTNQMKNKANFANWDFDTVWRMTTKPEFMFEEKGNGTIIFPYPIWTAQELYDMLKNKPNAVGILMADIDLTGFNWIPLYNNGTSTSNPTSFFKGGLIGNGYTIINPVIQANFTFVGLIGYAEEAYFKDIKVIGAQIQGRNYTGIIVGSCARTFFENCDVKGIITPSDNTTGYNFYGGIAGYISASTIKKCKSDIDLQGIKLTTLGGIVGNASSGALIGNYSKNKIIGSSSIGGIVGITTYAYLEENDCDVDLSGATIGGVVGNMQYIYKCNKNSAKGIVSGTDYVGGFAGRVLKSLNEENIMNCFSRCSVVGTSANIGAFIGYQQVAGTNNAFKIINSYFAGVVSGITKFIGVTAAPPSGSSYVQENLFYDSTLATLTDGKSTGKSTAEMQTQATFIGWDFDTVWEMDGYPTFAIQNEGGGGTTPIPVLYMKTIVDGITYLHPICSLVDENLIINIVRVVVDGTIYAFDIVEATNERASNLRILIDNKIYAYAKSNG